MLKKMFTYKWYVLVILFLLIIEPTLTAWLILWLQKIYNKVTIGISAIEIIKLILIGVLVWLLRRLMIFLISVLKSRFICNLKEDIKHDIFASALNLNTSSIFNRGSTGDYISTLTNDIAILEQRYFSNIINLLSKIFNIVILGSTFLTMNAKLGALVFCFGIIVMFVPPMFAKKLNDVNLKYSKSLSKFTQKIKEFLQGYSTIKNFSIESKILEKFNENNQSVENIKFEYDCTLSLADSIGSLLAWFTRLVVLSVGLVMVSKGEILLGTVIAAEAFAEELASPLQGMIENINSIKSVKSITQRINDLTKPIINDDDINDLNKDFYYENLNIEFKNLSICVNNKKIINNFSFVFEHGKKYLVIGKNGAGKSSIFKALKKQFNTYDGNILLNGENLKNISTKDLSKYITYLNEKVSIFSGSIEENITFWNNIPEDIYKLALKNAHVELNSNRIVGDEGFNISSGEQRRIEIARSFIFPSKVMVFDEIISTLDIETAYDIEKMALGFEDKTIIFISHNFSGKLISNYDEILVMKDGRLVGHGSYDALLKENEYFRNICEIKFGEKNNL